MENDAANSPSHAPSSATTVSNAHGSSSRPNSREKRPAPDSESLGSQEDAGEGHAQDTGFRSSKRLKKDGSSDGAEMPDTKSPGTAPLPVDPPPAEESQRAHSGWNCGVSRGLRTSFAGKDKHRKSLSQKAPESPPQPAAEGIDIETLIMPQGGDDLAGPGSARVWQARFPRWCVHLMALNKDQKGIKDSALLKEAWALWLETRLSLAGPDRAAAVQEATETDLGRETLERMFAEAQDTDPKAPWMDLPAGSGQSENSTAEPQRNGQPEDNVPSAHRSQDSDDWLLPPPQSCSDFEAKPRDQHAWEERFVAWCRSLLQLNGDKIKAGTKQERQRLIETYLKWVGTVDGLSKNKASAARRAAVHYAQDNSVLLVTLFAASTPTSEPQPAEPVAPEQEETTRSSMATSSNAPSDGSGHQADGADAVYRERYFPGVDANEAFCNMCATRGHDMADCPEKACRFCQSSQHRFFSCPTRHRCTKCKQLGHRRSGCKEKLALPRDEWECAFCQSRDHVDASCHEIWRSFVFRPGAVRKVRYLPVYCYCCGREGHHGGVCGLNPQGTKEGLWEIWSQANCDRYTDPASSEVAIIYGASSQAGPVSSNRPDLGKSIVPRRHIFFEEADDDDDDADDFIRPPVQKNMRVGYISFSGSSGGPNGGGGRQANKQYSDSNGQSGYAQPSIASGATAPLPPRSQQDRRNGGRRRGRSARQES